MILTAFSCWYRDFNDKDDELSVESMYIPPFLTLGAVVLAGSLVSAVVTVFLTRSHTHAQYARL
jgi:hypothetical protein